MTGCPLFPSQILGLWSEKVTVNWRELAKAEKVELVKAAWKKHWSASKIAAALSATLGGVRLTRNVVVGVYDRHPELRRSHPLGGSGAAKQRAHAEARAKLTQDEREAKAREREAKKQEREAKKQQREEKARRKEELSSQRHLSGARRAAAADQARDQRDSDCLRRSLAPGAVDGA